MTGALRVVLVKLVVFALFTVFVTGLLASVIGNIQPFTRFYGVDAEFADATGLLKADVVKIAGVSVGKVDGAEVKGNRALVHMSIRKDVTLPRNVRAAIRYRNLLGQRMVVLSRDAGDPDAPPLPKNGDALIPLDHTSPALDLGVVFNNLRPVIQSLDPEDANIVTRAVVKIFAGRELEVQRMVADLADLSETIGERGPVVADLIRDLDAVVTSLARSDRELRSVLSSFDEVLSSLSARSGELVDAVDTLGGASNDLADLLEGNRPGLDEAIAQLAAILDVVGRHKADIDKTLKELPGTTHALNRATTYASFANLSVVCLDGRGGPECRQQPPASSVSAQPDALGSIFRSAVAEDAP